MKKIYIIILISLVSFCEAQIVNIPDANLKTVLLAASPTVHVARAIGAPNSWVSIDTNNDGEIQLSEAVAIERLELSYIYSQFPIQFANIQSLEGIKSFTNLKDLSLGHFFQLTNIDVSNLTNLEKFSLEEANSVTSLNINGCTAITNLSVEKTSISTLNTAGLQLLKQFSCKENNALQTLNLIDNSQIKYLFADQNSFTSLNVSHLTELININLLGNDLTSLNLSNLLKLETIVCSGNNLTTLNLNNLPKLKSLEASYNDLTAINISQSPLLNYLRIIGNQISTIDLSNAPVLQTLFLNDNQFTTIDISKNLILNSLNIPNNNLQSIFMKNGRLTSLNHSGNPNLQYICCDAQELNQTINANSNQNYNNVTVNTYCNFTPGGTFYTIQGETRYDITNNGCDPADPKKSLQKFNVSGANGTGSVIGNTTGQYSLPVQAGSHTISPVLENPTYFNISPASFTANFPTQTSPLNQDFCLTPNGNHNDLEIVILPLNAARPGFVSEYKVLFKNKGTATQSGNFSFNYDDNLMNFLSTSLATSSQSFGVLNYNFTGLLPFQTRELTLKFTLNTPTATPPLNGNDILNYTAQINGLADETPLDNTFTLNQTVVNSFDPNDKTCLEGTQITQTKVGDYVHYLIRFENTGTANAENIVVKDMIDTSKYDINSLVALSGSDSFVTRITNANTVEFIFENIQLPFNDLYNDGYVSFKIKTKSTLVLGDSFSNTANIYFDYNAPIVTNTATTTVANILGTSEIIAGKNQIEFYPNPVVDIIKFNGKENVLKIEIFDASGRIISSKSVRNNEANLTDLQTGNYFLKIYTKDQYYVNKMMKK